MREGIHGDGEDVDGEKDEGEQRNVAVELVRDHAGPALGAQRLRRMSPITTASVKST